ncbi:hypothetical protein CRYUN_Cryun37aG0009600 [Craigia yunnanensis]
MKFSAGKVDKMIVQAIGLLDDLDKELNTWNEDSLMSKLQAGHLSLFQLSIERLLTVVKNNQARQLQAMSTAVVVVCHHQPCIFHLDLAKGRKHQTVAK